LGAVLNNQGGGQGHRPRSRHGLRGRTAVRRLRLGLQRARHGNRLQDLSARVDEQPVELAVRPSPAEPVGGTETVLLVEDEDVVRRLGRIALAKRGYRVLEAANGAEALLLCEREQRPIEMLITDVVMPGMTGPELARELASRRPQMKVLYVSGYPQRAMAQQRALPPGSAFLDKPFTLDAL